MKEAMLPNARPGESDPVTVRRLLQLAVQGLVPMFDSQRQLFCFRSRQTPQGMVQEGLSPRYTMMTLMGLHRLEQNGSPSPFDTGAILQSLLANLDWVDTLGDLGVLLWMCGVVCPEQFPTVTSVLKPETALARFAGGQRGITMELAWFLTGLSYWGQAYPEQWQRIEPIAAESHRALAKNRGPHGFYGHQATRGSLAGMIRGRVGSFADQVYPIYALTQFSKCTGSQQEASLALETARGICRAQGPQGQWWWHYDSASGKVADGYPVFSVHQHAMAPMTLLELGEFSQTDFHPWIYRGLDWISSANELNFNMEDAGNGVVWRCIYRARRSAARYLTATLGMAPEQAEPERAGNLKILRECRPYELGWMLYAFASRMAADRTSMVCASQLETAGATRRFQS